MKIVGILILIAACSFMGWREARKLSRRVEELEAIRLFVVEITTEIRFAALPIQTLIQNHSTEAAWLELCTASLKKGTPFPQAWAAAVAAVPLHQGDRALLQAFGTGLGKTDIAGQITHCGLYEAKFASQLAAAREEQTRKAKLYIMLGISVGLTASLIVL